MINVKIEKKYTEGRSFWKKIGIPTLRKTENLIACTLVEIPTLGVAQVSAKAFDCKKKFPLYFVDRDNVLLFELDWCLSFKLPLPPGSRLYKVKRIETL